MNKHKQFIKDAYNDKLGLTMCSDWKEAIEETYPEFNERVKLEVGKWYKITDSQYTFEPLICFSGFGRMNYGFNGKGDWFPDFNVYEDENCIKPATDQEVEELLIKEAKKRGLKPLNHRCLEDGLIWINNIGGNYEYVKPSGKLQVGASTIFLDGVWAIPLETITKEEAEKQLGKTII